MPRGSTDGSIVKKGARFVVRKRYTDQNGLAHSKTRSASTRAKAEQVLQELEGEIAAARVGVDPSELRRFDQLVCGYLNRFNREVKIEPEHHLAATLLKLENGLRRLCEILPELERLQLDDFCNAVSFRPSAFGTALIERIETGLRRMTSEQQVVAAKLSSEREQ